MWLPPVNEDLEGKPPDVSRAACKGRPGSEGMSPTSTRDTRGAGRATALIQKANTKAKQPATYGEIYSGPGRPVAASGRGGGLGGGG